MLSIVWLSQFKKDFKVIRKRKKKLEKLEVVLNELQSHRLKGKYTHCLECHIEPDWLLIYRLAPEKLILVRTGSHSDLF